MRWTVLAASTAIAATLWLPGEVAQAATSVGAVAEPAAPGTANAGAGNPITFEQYRDWRLDFIERRQTDLARQLAASDLPMPQKARLEQVKAGIMELTAQTVWGMFSIKEIPYGPADRAIHPMLP
jgi:hypothetical protein